MIRETRSAYDGSSGSAGRAVGLEEGGLLRVVPAHEGLHREDAGAAVGARARGAADVGDGASPGAQGSGDRSVADDPALADDHGNRLASPNTNTENGTIPRSPGSLRETPGRQREDSGKTARPDMLQWS